MNDELHVAAGGDMAAVIKTAQEAVGLQEVPSLENAFAVVRPEGSTVEVVDIDRLQDTPRRKKGQVTVYDAESLARYVNRHKNGASVLYMNDGDGYINYTVVAVLNDHGEEDPGWGDHRAILVMRATDEWDLWRKRDAKLGTQEEFAELIEDRLDDIVSPSGADLLELAQTFQATTEIEFRQGTRLYDGTTQFLYSEDTKATAGAKGQITIPKEFSLRLAPFVGSEPQAVTARLRYRLRDGRLSIGYVLKNPKEVERAAFGDVVNSVEEATNLEALYGIHS